MAMETIPLANDGGEPVGDTVVIDRHLYLTEDRERVVEEGDADARWLWATPGMRVPQREAERLGAVTADSEADPVEDTAKQRTPAQNKQRKPRENKAKNEEAPPAEEE